MESRHDILVYTSEPFKEGIEVSGPIDADALCLIGREGHRLHGEGAGRLSDGRAFNLDDQSSA